MKQALTGPDVGPRDPQVIGSRMVLRNKYRADGTFERRKARLVAQGFSQKPGIHFSETFAPVARFSSIRLVASLAAQYGMKIKQFDVKTTYLNGELEEEIFMKAPKDSKNSWGRSANLKATAQLD
jgi:hypothetical protein